MGRVILVVMDGCGVGALPDAANYGTDDPDSNTLAHVFSVHAPQVENLQRMGLGCILSLRGVDCVKTPSACYGRMLEQSAGKDSVTGHWEMIGVVTQTPFPTYPDGFPAYLIGKYEKAIGRKVIGNVAASGTQIIARLGEEHLRTGFPIVYTSADSVFQVAAHEDVMPIDALYRICSIARELLVSPDNIQRVIARPFIGSQLSGFVRTPRRRDFPLAPPEPNLLSAIKTAGFTSAAIGVIADLFPHDYFTYWQRTQSNAQHLAALLELVSEHNYDFMFANFEDFDMLFGHRNDPQGFARALEEFDRGLGGIISLLRGEDLLIITADHGNDPTTKSTDHSREYVPVLVYSKQMKQAGNLGTRAGFGDIAATVARELKVDWSGPGSVL